MRHTLIVELENNRKWLKWLSKVMATVVYFARPNPTQICACAWIYRWTKKLWKIRTVPPGHRGPPGRPGPLGHWAVPGHWAGPARGCRAAGTSRATDRWAAGLLLAKPLVFESPPGISLWVLAIRRNYSQPNRSWVLINRCHHVSSEQDTQNFYCTL